MSELEKALLFVGAVVLALVISLSVLFTNRAEKRGACNALGGTFLNQDEVCLDIKSLPLRLK